MKQDKVLVAYLLSTFSRDVLGIEDGLTAKDLWESLHDQFSQVTSSKAMQLKAKHQNLRKNDISVIKYWNKMKVIADELALIGQPISDVDKVQQILTRLGSDFDMLVISLECQPKLPSYEALHPMLP